MVVHGWLDEDVPGGFVPEVTDPMIAVVLVAEE